MSLLNRVFLVLSLSALALLAACGGNNGNSVTNPVTPPSGGFSTSNLNGTYVFSVSGTDSNGYSYAAVGTLTANGSGGITAGVIDLNDAAFPAATPTPISPVANAAFTSGSYTVGVDGRGQAKIYASTPFSSPIILDFVLQDNSHGLVTEFDGNASGTGTLDLQSSGVTATGTYAFIFSGAYNGSTLSTAGNFTVTAGAVTGIEDLTQPGIPYVDETLSGTLALGPSSSPATSFSAAPSTGTANFAITYDVVAIDATHLKFIEMDSGGTLSGDAYAQSSTSVPTGNLAFTLLGSGTSTSTIIATGGFIVTDGNGNVTSASTQDVNNTGSVSAAPINFSGTYAAGGTGRYTFALTGFNGATTLSAYPSTGGLLLLQIDAGGTMAGAAYQQTSGSTIATSQGYALNLTGINLGAATGSSAEVDDIAEFATASSGLTLTGVTDENYAPAGAPNYGIALTGTYTTPDSNGRGTVIATAGNSSNGTLNGGFGAYYYAVDGTTFPFIENDNGQVTVGVFLKQNSSSSSAALKSSHPLFVPSLMHVHADLKKR